MPTNTVLNWLQNRFLSKLYDSRIADILVIAYHADGCNILPKACRERLGVSRQKTNGAQPVAGMDDADDAGRIPHASDLLGRVGRRHDGSCTKSPWGSCIAKGWESC